jgi:hypothetical protein
MNCCIVNLHVGMIDPIPSDRSTTQRFHLITPKWVAAEELF